MKTKKTNWLGVVGWLGVIIGVFALTVDAAAVWFLMFTVIVLLHAYCQIKVRTFLIVGSILFLVLNLMPPMSWVDVVYNGAVLFLVIKAKE